MSESKTRRPIFQDYYTEEDYEAVLTELPELIKKSKIKAEELLEPTIEEKRKVMDVIKDFIRKKNRKVYGGTALNELIKVINPQDVFYDERIFEDIEFYSPTPVPDLVELTNILYEKGFKYVKGAEAQHEETYTIFVNLQKYGDISYVPTRVYNGIKTITVDGINYVDPHFMLIDYFRIINDPINAAAQRWEKTFKRMFKLLKYYPLEYYDKKIQIPKPSDEKQSYFNKIKTDFMGIPEVQQSCLINGFDAYNFYIRHAAGDRTVEQQARTTYHEKDLMSLVCNVPFMEFVSVNYHDTVERLYNFIRNIVKEPKEVTIEEYYPLFQFTNYSVTIKYKGETLARVFEANGYCIPNVKTTRGYMFVSYQYLLMTMFINKFRAHLDKDREMYFNYGIVISNLVNARNVYLTKNNLPVINNTVFSEFRIGCVGSTVSYMRMSLLRGMEKKKQGKIAKFYYEPVNFFAQSEEAQAKFDPGRYQFRNKSGNKITNPKNLLFKLDENGNIIKQTGSDDSEPEEEIESSSGTD